MVFHNLSNYDAHLFIKKIFIKNPKERLQCIPNNEEKYISFSKEIVFCHITDEEGERKPVKREILSSIIFHDSSSIVFGLWG